MINWYCLGLSLFSCALVGWACWMLGKEHEKKRLEKIGMLRDLSNMTEETKILLKEAHENEEDTSTNYL